LEGDSVGARVGGRSANRISTTAAAARRAWEVGRQLTGQILDTAFIAVGKIDNETFGVIARSVQTPSGRRIDRPRRQHVFVVVAQIVLTEATARRSTGRFFRRLANGKVVVVNGIGARVVATH